MEHENEEQIVDMLLQQQLNLSKISEFPEKVSNDLLKNYLLDNSTLNQIVNTSVMGVTDAAEKADLAKAQEEENNRRLIYVIEQPTAMFKHVRKKKTPTLHERYFRVNSSNLSIYWGNSRTSMSTSEPIIDIVTGDEARSRPLPTNKIGRQLDANNSFIIKTRNPNNDLYLVARDFETYATWTDGIRYLLSQQRNAHAANTASASNAVVVAQQEVVTSESPRSTVSQQQQQQLLQIPNFYTKK